MQDNYEKLNAFVTRIARHKGALGLNDTQYAARFQRFLGSTRTLERLLKREFKEFGSALPKWEKKLEAMVGELDGRSPDMEYFADMPLCVAATDIYNRLQERRDDRRCGVILGTTGTGKSAWARSITNRFPRETAYVRSNEAWRDSKGQIILGIGRAVGFNLDAIHTTAGRLGKLIEQLKLSPVTVIIDEAHEGGVLLMKLVKTLIDETSCKFILLAYPTTWRRVMTATDDARAEAQQLFGRTLKPVYDAYHAGLDRTAVATYLRKAAGFDDDADAIATRILPMVRNNGNLRVLADAVELAQLQGDATEETVDAEMLIAHLARLCPVGKEAK